MNSILISVYFIAVSYQQTCNQTGLDKLDEQSGLLYAVGSPSMKFPENNDQLKVWCK